MINYDSAQALHDFVHSNDLMDRVGNVEFEALVTIKTSSDKIVNKMMLIRIVLSDYNSMGRLILNCNLELDNYPLDFDAKYQEFQFIDGEYLLIKGKHINKPTIGNYEVKINPIKR